MNPRIKRALSIFVCLFAIGLVWSFKEGYFKTDPATLTMLFVFVIFMALFLILRWKRGDLKTDYSNRSRAGAALTGLPTFLGLIFLLNMHGRLDFKVEVMAFLAINILGIALIAIWRRWPNRKSGL